MIGTSDATFRSQAISALGCTDSVDDLYAYLETSLGDGSNVNYSRAERRSVFSAVLNSYSGLEAVIKFIREFELDIMNQYAYTLEEILTIPARTIKNRAQQSAYVDFLISLDHLDSSAYARIVTIIEATLQTQQTSLNLRYIELIRGILGKPIDDTTVAPTTAPPTTAPPTIPPTTVPPTAAPTTPEEEPTTLGASSNGIKLITIVTLLFVAFFLKN